LLDGVARALQRGVRYAQPEPGFGFGHLFIQRDTLFQRSDRHFEPVALVVIHPQKQVCAPERGICCDGLLELRDRLGEPVLQVVRDRKALADNRHLWP
jgi:hypothetical protein